GKPDGFAEREKWEEWSRGYFATRQDAREPLPGGRGRMPPRPPGAYMAPISYQDHCAACHPLRFDPRIRRQVSHRLQPGELRGELRAIYAERAIFADEDFLPRTPFLPLPGRRKEDLPLKDLQRRSVDQKVAQGMRALMEGKRACGECHVDAQGHDLTAETTA